MTNQMTIDYPARLPDLLQESPLQFEQEARLAMAVKLFETHRIPSGLAAELAGLDRVTFLLRLHEHGVCAIDLTPDELTSDITNA